MPERKNLRLPSWVVLAAVLLGVIVLLPASVLVYVGDGYTDRGAMRVFGLMLLPMLPFLAVSFWRGLEIPDANPPLTEDRSRDLVIGERRSRPFGGLSAEGVGLYSAGLCLAGAAALAVYGFLWTALAVFAFGVGCVALAAWSHVRRVNREEEG